MFCEQCGKKFGVDAKFCGGCGTPREADEIDPPDIAGEDEFDGEALEELMELKAAQYANKPGFEDVPSRYLHDSKKSDFPDWMAEFMGQKLPLSAQLEGFMNAELGEVWISTKPVYSCQACDRRVIHKFGQVDCAECGKTSTNFCSVPIGKGDGTYPVYHLQPSSGSGFLAVLATEASEDGHGAIPELLNRVLVEDFDDVGTRELVVKVPISSILSLPEFVTTKVGSITVEAEDLKIGSLEFPGLSQMLVSSPRTREHLDGAEVRIGWEPGEFEVLAITRYSTLENVRESLQSGAEDMPYFERPEVLAVLVVRADEVSELFPPYKRIATAREVQLFESSDRWIEYTRPLHGYLFAIWANWILVTEHLKAYEDEDWNLSEVFMAMAGEGYLHQIWNMLHTKPSTLGDQISELGDFTSLLEEVVDRSATPELHLARSDLREWFLQGPDPSSTI